MDEKYMQQAIALAREGVSRGDGGPFGAVVVKDGEVVGRGWNRVIAEHDPTAHAEIQAIRQAARQLESHDLSGCQLYSSCEPCPMCLSAAYWARIGLVVYGASGADAAALGFDDRSILEELNSPKGSRRMPSRQLLREAALEVFKQWQESDLGRLY